MEKIDMPDEIILLTTGRCNSRCGSCNIWKQKCSKDLESKFYNNLPSSLKKISFSGGEPSLRNDLAEIAGILDKKCNHPRFVISTNGLSPFLVEKRVREILKITKKLGVRVSIDGIGELNDRLRGVKGAFENAMQTIKICKKLGIKDLGIALTIQEKNLDEARKVYLMARKLKIGFSCCPVDNSFRYKKFDNQLSNISKIREVMNFLIKNELERSSPKAWFRSYFYYGMFHYLRERIHGKNKMVLPCVALRKFFLLSPEGNIFPCTLQNKNIGGIKDENFYKLWASKKAQETRRIIKKCPITCWTACNVNTTIKKNKFKVASWVLANKIKSVFGARNFV